MGAAKAYQGSSKPFLKFAQSQSSLKHEDVILVLPNNVFPNPKLPGQGPTATVREVAGVAIDLASDLVTAKQQQATEVNCGQVDIHVGSTVYGLFCILDGHNGVTAANHVANSLQEVLTARLPAGEPPLESDGELYRSWRGHLQKALVGALSDLHLSFACLGLAAGCTATIILQCGWLVTVANLGDSRAVLDTGFETRQLTVDHRVATHQGERKRLESSGALIAPVDLSGTGPAQGPQAGGFGPLRVWPGGLCLSRAIGDFDVGEVIIPCPHICQVRVPETGGRVLVASDGVWDAFDKMGRVARMARGWATEVAPDRILGAIKRAYGGLRDDSSVVILDLLPPGQDFPSVARSTRKSMKPGCLSCFAPPPPAPGTDGNEAPQMEVLVDVDVAALLGLMPGVSVPRPEWCDDDFKVAMASAQAEAARIWRKANSMRRLGRSPSRDDLQSIFQPFGIAAPFPPSPKAVAVAAGGPDRPSQPSPIDRDPSVKVGASDTPAAKAALEEARRAALESGQNASGRFGRSTTTDQGFSGRFGKYHGNGGGSGSGGMKPSTSSGALSKLPTITAGEALDTSADSQQLVPSASHEDMVAGVEVGASQRFGDAIATEERYAAKFGHYKASSRMQWEAERSASPDPAAAGESKPERAKRRSIEFADWFKRHASLGRPGSPSPADRRLSLDRAQLTDGAATTSGNPNYPASSTPADERGPGRRRPMRSLDDISTRLRDQDMSMARRVQDSRTAGGDSRGSQSLRGASSDVRSSTAGSVSGSAVVQETSAQPATQPLGQPAAGGTPLQRSAGQTGVRSGSGTPSSSQYGTPDGSPRSHMSSASTLSRYASAYGSPQTPSDATPAASPAPPSSSLQLSTAHPAAVNAPVSSSSNHDGQQQQHQVEPAVSAGATLLQDVLAWQRNAAYGSPASSSAAPPPAAEGSAEWLQNAAYGRSASPSPAQHGLSSYPIIGTPSAVSTSTAASALGSPTPIRTRTAITASEQTAGGRPVALDEGASEAAAGAEPLPTNPSHAGVVRRLVQQYSASIGSSGSMPNTPRSPVGPPSRFGTPSGQHSNSPASKAAAGQVQSPFAAGRPGASQAKSAFEHSQPQQQQQADLVHQDKSAGSAGGQSSAVGQPTEQRTAAVRGAWGRPGLEQRDSAHDVSEPLSQPSSLMETGIYDTVTSELGAEFVASAADPVNQGSAAGPAGTAAPSQPSSLMETGLYDTATEEMGAEFVAGAADQAVNKDSAAGPAGTAAQWQADGLPSTGQRVLDTEGKSRSKRRLMSLLRKSQTQQPAEVVADDTAHAAGA